MEGIQRFRYNVMGVSDLRAFENVKGGMNCDCKDVYFIRAVGVNDTLIHDIERMDRNLTIGMNEGKGYYNRLDGLPKFVSTEDSSYYSGCYTGWMEHAKKETETKATGKNTELKRMLGNACREVECIYCNSANSVTESMKKNLIVKMLFWYDFIFSDPKFDGNPKNSVKIVFSNIEKKHEYLFCYLVTLMGCDVLLLQSGKDISQTEENMQLSQKLHLGEMKDIAIPQYIWNKIEAPMEAQSVRKSAQKEPGQHKSVAVHLPERRRSHASGNCVSDRREKSFEELARLASSVVLIAIHNQKGDVIGSGSGIMIGKDGYILTNNHVASGGKYYSVRIEDDEQVYRTDEVIKYHSVLDLAIIRIQRPLIPLPVYQGKEKLVRGQKVVAIGSPLGLFNSVSDGIISGFRRIDTVDMIQFTAPISHGSSGGAVLNMYGEVIGISTAGFDYGQNINLAMGYECINLFIRGFV